MAKTCRFPLGLIVWPPFGVPAPEPPPVCLQFFLVTSFLVSVCSQVSGRGQAPAPRSAARFSPMLASTSTRRHARNNAYCHAHDKHTRRHAHSNAFRHGHGKSISCAYEWRRTNQKRPVFYRLGDLFRKTWPVLISARSPKLYLPGRSLTMSPQRNAKKQEKRTQS